MKYYVLEPEVAGKIGPESDADFRQFPPLIQKLQYLLDGWLGDDLLESFPCFIATERLKAHIQQLSLSGHRFNPVQITKSVLFQELYPNRELPNFVWLVPEGRAGIDDFGVSEVYQLVVSERAWEVISQYQVNHCDVQAYVQPTNR